MSDLVWLSDAQMGTHPAWAAGVTFALGSVRLAVLACAVQAA